MKLICVHGWACGPEIWTLMLDRLKSLIGDDGFEVQQVDLGFYGDEQIGEFGSFDLAIGHSLGLQWLLTSQRVRFDRLISINGFTRFSAAKDFQSGWPHRILQRMQRQLARDSAKVVGDFLQKAWCPASESSEQKVGLEPPSAKFAGAVDVERLNWGLDALLNGDGREQWGAFDGPKRVIAATKDPVVTVEHTNACFAGSDLQWLKSDCHLLPLKFPEICAALVRELIEVS